MYRYANGAILANADALDEESVLEDTQVREAQIKELWFCLSPLQKRKAPINCWIYGQPGTGKTAITRYVLKQIESLAGAKVVYVNCWEKNTFYGVLDRIITELRILGPEKPATSQKLEILQRYLRDNSLVVILDDIDRPSPTERNAILYNLCNLQRLGLVCISKSSGTVFELEERIKSRLNPVMVEFPKYSQEELLNILERKAEQALAQGKWDKGVLDRIAGLADGDARVAVQALKNAAYFAQKATSDRISELHVLEGWNDIRSMDKDRRLTKLTYHHTLLYDLIKDRKKVLSNELWDCYLEKCGQDDKKPIATRTYPDYINELRDMGLVSVKRAPVRGRVREITIV
ncbi:MAG: AAA family ATPase [Thermodesulfobacteriota bacterium]